MFVVNRKQILILSFIATVLATYLFIHVRAVRAGHRFEETNAIVIAHWQRTLRIGMTREEVSKLLDAQKVQYSGMGGRRRIWSYAIFIARTPPEMFTLNPVCNGGASYVYLDFEGDPEGSAPSDFMGSPDDRLVNIQLGEQWTCL